MILGKWCILSSFDICICQLRAIILLFHGIIFFISSQIRVLWLTFEGTTYFVPHSLNCRKPPCFIIFQNFLEFSISGGFTRVAEKTNGGGTHHCYCGAQQHVIGGVRVSQCLLVASPDPLSQRAAWDGTKKVTLFFQVFLFTIWNHGLLTLVNKAFLSPALNPLKLLLIVA